jgi:sulfate permease, SulP family
MPLTSAPEGWLQRYDCRTFRGDLVAGLTVGIMLVPQGMAYALIAGLPPIYGLYAALVPLGVYALLGTSRQLAVGPVAIVSILVAAGVAPLAGDDPARFIELALLLSLMSGVIQLVLGLARAGFVMNFFSHPVLSGFTSAAAIIIGLSQAHHLLGVGIGGGGLPEVVGGLIGAAGRVHPATLAIGIVSIGILVTVRRWKRTAPGALIVVVLGTTLMWYLAPQDSGVAIVGAVPDGLPAFFVPGITMNDLRALLPAALTISLIGYMESMAVARVYAVRNGYRVDADRELIALGAANIAGGLFQAYPTTGGFSRTAVNAGAGARTRIASVVSASMVAVTLLLLTPLFFYLPYAVLAAIILVAVAGLVDVREAVHLWKVDRRDLAMLLLTFAATLILGIEAGILTGVGASLVMVLHQSYRPHFAVMGRLPGTNSYRNVLRFPEAETDERILIARMDASLYFANAPFLREKLFALAEERPRLRVVVLDLYPVNSVDSSGAAAIREIVRWLGERGIRLLIAGAKGPVRDVLQRSGVTDLIGGERFFLEVHQADEAARVLAEASGERSASAEVPA